MITHRLCASATARNSLQGMAITGLRRYDQGMTASTVAGRPAVQESFGAELRRWRERRRVSQLELALRAGTTQRHLSFVENGRSVPGREMVVRLAESLDLPLRERNELLLRAGYAPAYPEAPSARRTCMPCARRSRPSSQATSPTQR